MKKYIVTFIVFYGLMSQKLLFEGTQILEREYSAYTNLRRTVQAPVQQRSQLDVGMELTDWRVVLEFPPSNNDAGGITLSTDTVEPLSYR